MAVFYLWVYYGEVLVQRSISSLEIWNKLLYVHPCLPHLQLTDRDQEQGKTETQGITIPQHEVEQKQKYLKCANEFGK